ncbi:FAD-binding domain-containing protein [Annulohypoxylon maeteangense]|uniref:FAD-binding domain-containing protein n=1 Tax=Annulohypoxylon maeteangense TaxID=1927788 RepID=UPI0020082BA4|nr:FAD-binding domain-containing protein [Annulohypoxylon maeteangense]KAI0886801.1 FAD-binding domain-containing protein [Annulohypoxylon maeteangense]
MKPNLVLVCLSAFIPSLAAFKPRELLSDSIRLTQEDIGDFAAIKFGDETAVIRDRQVSNCKVFPGDEAWPSTEEWTRLNDTIGGVLLKPEPAAAACYQGPGFDQAGCTFLLTNASSSHYWLDDPLVALTQWSQGSTCPLASDPQGNCTRGGFPEYVVNATNVRHIQAAVNFARNKNIRLIVKNTGHDFGGRSIGAGSLSVWTHHLKEMEFIPSYSIGPYNGMAAHLGSGVESWEEHNFMNTYNTTIVSPGCGTVGGVGGWMSAGGHTTITSTYGLGADQVLSLGVVTASGSFVTADPFTNTDLFYAIRGGGGATYGIVTSAIYKAYPPVNISSSSLSFTLSQPSSTPGPNIITDAETFWQGVGAYYRFAAQVLDAGGFGFGYIYPGANQTFRFTTSSSFPNLTPAAAFAFMQPLYDTLADLNINLPNPTIRSSSLYGSRGVGIGPAPGNTRYRSRLLPRANWENDTLWNATISAIRTATSGGFDNDFYFHATLTSPTLSVAGWPGNTSAVNPAWRSNRMHAMLMDSAAVQSADRDDTMRVYMDLLREVSPGAGAYMNEGDPGEPEWQQAFYGENYARLLEVKRERDPWGVFWAPTTVGSEAWRVSVVDGYGGSQNGRLCRTGV